MRSSRIHHVIAELPEGYDTVVGERATDCPVARSSGSPLPACC